MPLVCPKKRKAKVLASVQPMSCSCTHVQRIGTSEYWHKQGRTGRQSKVRSDYWRHWDESLQGDVPKSIQLEKNSGESPLQRHTHV